MRSTTVIQTKATKTDVDTYLQPFFKEKGYSYQKYKGEMVWKKGKGFLVSPQIFKVEYDNNQLKIQGFIPFALLPGVYVGESGLESWFGALPKEVMRTTLKEIIHMFIAEGTHIVGYAPK